MSETQAQFSVLKQTADPAVADAIRALIENGQDHELNRINLLDFSKRTGLDEQVHMVAAINEFSDSAVYTVACRTNVTQTDTLGSDG